MKMSIRSTWFRGDKRTDWKGLTKTGRMKRKPSQKDGKARAKNNTVVFVPRTSGGVLVRRLKDMGKGRQCGRSPCPPCDSSDKRQKSRNLVYAESFSSKSHKV
jgi:hypothetical protein